MIRDNKINKLKAVKQHKGFTLIEVMVSVSLFAMIMTLSLGAILSIIDGNKKAQAINAVANNLNFAVESMVRDIKTGYAYTCDLSGSNNPSIPPLSYTSNIDNSKNGCSNPATPTTALSLVSTITGEKRGVKYSLKTIDGKSRIYKVTTEGTSAEYPVTSPEVDIQKMEFYVDNPISNEGQPKIFLIIKGTATINPTQVSDFSIQTLISQRNLNLLK
jgi:prepilin-type N-terminal cleavage/methylation domain-containing protein